MPIEPTDLEKELRNIKHTVHSHEGFMKQIEAINQRRMVIRSEIVQAKDEREILGLVDELERLMVQWHRLFIDTNNELMMLRTQAPEVQTE